MHDREEKAVIRAVPGKILWWRSALCDGGECIEVAALGAVIALRDSKDPDGPVITISRENWRHFLARVKSGAFELT